MLNIGRHLIKCGQNLMSNVKLDQVRTTFVVKRKYPLPLSRKGHKPRKLQPRNFVYEFIEDTNLQIQPDLHLILTTYVEGVGKRGDEVKVRPQYGYEKLLLPGFAEYATDEARNRLAAQGSSNEPEFSSPYVERMMTIMSKIVIDVVMNKEEPWTIEPWHIRTCMRKCGLIVKNNSQITLPTQKISGPDMNLQGKEFLAYVLMNNKEKLPVRCRIHHWSTKISDRLPHEIEPWTKPAEPLFPEQAEELAKIPLPESKLDDAPLLLNQKR